MTLTPQEIFTKAYLGVVGQGRLSLNPENSACFYSYPSDHCIRCAVGHLIDDPELRARMDSTGSVKVIGRSSLLEDLPDWFRKNLTLLDEMQKAHDGWGTTPSTVETFKAHMAQIAKDHKLHVPDIPAPAQPG